MIGLGILSKFMILLDTCAFIWLAGIDTKLSITANNFIQDSDLFLSAISVFEISMLV